MTRKTVKGSFEIETRLLPADEAAQAVGAMRMSFDKEFEGPLSGKSFVSMMGVMNREIGSGAYVALEKFMGKLEGRAGSCGMQHSSSMDRGKPTQSILVIPDSGTDGLAGLRGEMTIDIIDEQHYYTFTYELP